MLVNRLLLGWVACFGLFLTSIFAETPAKPYSKEPAQSFSIPKELSTWNKKQKVALQEHQLKPIAYLEKNTDIKGLIINHWLGTGKTLLAIGFAERNPKHPVIILAPSFLKGHWMRELEKFGVKDKSRYRFVTHNQAQLLTQEDLSKTILILDESHRIIEQVRSPEKGLVYAPLYFNLRKAYRVLSLTGTPIYNDMFDLVYQVNLVSGKDEFSFNKEEFRLAYTEINAFKACWRGYALDNFYVNGFATPLGDSILATLVMVGVPAFPAVIASLVPGLSYIFASILIPIENNPLRVFQPDRLANITKKYISHYTFDQDARFYPKKSLLQRKLNYNDAQLSILYRFYDSRLNLQELKQILKDKFASGDKMSEAQKANYHLNNSLVQDLYKKKIGAGREIGNFSFVNKFDLKKNNKKANKAIDDVVQDVDGPIIFPEKFKLILKDIEMSKGPVVVYSHYYENGILLFKQFLDAFGYRGKYRVFHPEVSSEKNMQIIDEYNSNQVKILLLHPDITEGISLKGTRQLHFLESPTSSEAANQVIGRAIRYESHMHLPENERNVEVCYSNYTLSMFDLKALIAARENWYHNFSELSYYSRQGEGRIQVDKNAALKKESPDMRAYIYLNISNQETEEFRRHLKIFCIENMYSGLEG